VFKFITDKPLWVNILVAIAFVLVTIFLFFFSLVWITHHGETEKLPNIIGQNVVAATKLLEAKGFDVEVVDSVFIDSTARLAVIKQSPEADAVVKAGRTVYLTVNRAIAPEVEMPSLIGFSIKSAQMMLQSLNLKLGDTSYKPDIARNSVLEQLYNGNIIKQGTKIPMGSTIDFVLGSGPGLIDLDVPNLVGMRVVDALTTLQSLKLSVGPIIARTPVSDTLNSFVVDQTPKAFNETIPGQKVQNKLRAGQIVDLFISNAAPTTIADTSTTIQN